MFLTLVNSSIAVAQTSAAYLSNTSQPWGQTSNITALNTIYPSDWTQYYYNSYDANQIFVPSRKLVLIEGGNSDTSAMISVLTTHQTLIENWVSNGGVLFLSAATNQTFPNNTFSMGFGISSTRILISRAAPLNTNHPFFADTPYQPIVAAEYTGNYIAHNVLTGAGLDPIITISASDPAAGQGHVFAEKTFGSGKVLFSGMTTPFFITNTSWQPQPQMSNMLYAMIDYGRSLGVSNSVENIATNSADLLVTTSLNSNGYYVVVPSGSTPPTSSQIIQGTSYTGGTVVNSGGSSITANTQTTYNISGLNALTNYTVYFVSTYLGDNNELLTSDISTIDFTTLYACATIDQRSNGNGQANLCPGVSGTPTNPSVTSTVYANVPVTAKTGNIRFKYTAATLPGIIPAIGRIWINGVQSTAQPGPPSVTTTSGGDYLVTYCFYNINLPNAGNYTLEFINPSTGEIVGRCTYNGATNVSTTEPTLISNTNPTITAIANQTICQAATPATINFTIGDTETTDLTLMTVSATSSNTTLLPNANLVLGGTTAARTLSYTFAAGQTGTTTITITVVDPSGGTATRTFTITHLTTLVLNAASQTNIACFGNATGAASVSAATGGAGGYTYNWTPGNPTGDGTTSVTGLTAGTWTCTVTDANGCTASRTFTITQPSSALALTAASQTNIACNGNATGAASVNAATGGSGGYTYN